jgi:hypothetical protein
MSTEYKIETVGGQFIVVDPLGEIVDRYPSEEEARQNIERCKREVAISDKAHLLVENAIKALMQLNGLDRETAERGIREVVGGT